MKAVVLTVPAAAVEDVLDRLLPVAPGGVRVEREGRSVKLVVSGPELPTREQLKAAAGRWPHVLSERELADDWRARRVAAYRPGLIGGRLLVRPAFAPPSRAALEVVLADADAFGSGAHPTTRELLEVLLDVPAGGSFADLGCGSGVLAITAAKLGWSPVWAVDLSPGAVAAAAENARLSQVQLECTVADLVIADPPAADAVVANVPSFVHAALVRSAALSTARWMAVSGFGEPDEAVVLRGYETAGLRAAEVRCVNGWIVAILSR